MIDWEELTLFLYVLARMSGFVLFNPLFGRNNIPTVFQTGLALMLSVTAMSAPVQAVTVPATTLELMIKLLLELAIGLVLGMAMNFFFYIPQLAGEVVDTQMGMTMNQVYDASSRANMSVSGRLLNVLMTLLFFAANGHHTLVRLVVTSGQIVPFGTAALGDSVYQAMLKLFVEYTLLAVKLSMPILAAELVGQLGMGLLMKVIPQINIFAINIDIKVIIGMTILFLLIAPFSEFILRAEGAMLNQLGEILSLMG